MSENAEFVSRKAAVRILGAGPRHVETYAKTGLVGVLRLPGLPPRYRRLDLIALRDRCTIPAEVEPSGALVEV